jgi:hypothetical protein
MTGELVSTIPMITSATIVIQVTLPPPSANVRTVEALVAQPGHTY